MKKGLVFLIFLVLAVVIVAGGTFYIVDERQQVVITQFGKPVGEPISEPGLHIKVPFVQTANYFDKRFLAWDGSPNQIPTKDKRFIWVDTYARWRIADPLLFFQRLRDERGAQSRLDDILDGETRNVVAKHDLIELVRSSNPPELLKKVETPFLSAGEPLEPIKDGRSKLANEVLTAASKRVKDLGIELLDFKFKRINYVEAVRKEVYARMISERKRIAEQYRSEGLGEAARIKGEKERMLKNISSDAYRKAQEIKGRADQKAAEIYAKAYAKDLEFYKFLRTMDLYKKALDSNTRLIITTDGELFKYLKNAHSKVDRR